MARFLLIVNAAAGAAEEQRVEAARALLAGAGGVDVVHTRAVEELEAALAGAEGRRVVVAGGDGSIHLTVQLLWHRHPAGLATTELGLVPLGTGNDLATGLGLPADPVEAARVCAQGRPRRLDLIVADDGAVVVNAAHAGLGAAAAQRAEGLKQPLGALAYPVGALVAGVREAGYQLKVSLDGRGVHDGGTLMVGVANGPSIGGGTALVPQATPDDGLLDLVVVGALGPAARLAFAAALRSGTHLDRDDVLWMRGRAVTIAGDPVAHDLDGEVTEEASRRRYELVPAAWQLLAPP
ncbi:MAG: hypothetical protein M3276_10600 [Actinomycetota bacterium]|nr:hypothetical protein [Actinomycetota bacterium]